MTSITHNKQKNMTKVTLTNGYWFYFDDQGNQIAFHGSAYSGKETVYFNDEPVSEQRVLTRTSSCHRFSQHGREYELLTQVGSLIRGEVSCELKVDGVSVGKRTKAFLEKGNISWLKLILGIGACFIGGYAVGWLAVTIAKALV